MKYITYEYFQSLYGTDYLSEADFNRLGWESEREVDKATTCLNNVQKLKVAFPTDEDTAEAVKRCICSVVDFLYQIDKAQKGANASLEGSAVASKSAGNESISYSVGKTMDTSVTNAIMSAKGKGLEINRLISDKLSGLSDNNGVSLLYLGSYPLEV